MRSRVSKLVDVASDYLRDGDTDTALEMVKKALNIYPDYVDALRLKGKIKFVQDQYTATLENYRQAFEQDRDPASPAGKDYLEILKHMAIIAWQKADYQKAAMHYSVIKQVLDEGRQSGAADYQGCAA